MLTGSDSSLVIDSLCSLAEGGNATVAYIYFDFATQKEQSPVNTLGYLLRQLVFGLEEIPEEISRAYEDQKSVIGEQGPQISAILKMLQTTSSKKPAFICIDGLDECRTEYRVKLLDAIRELLQHAPGIRIFVTGRPNILLEIEKSLAGSVASVSISPKRDDVIRYIHSRLAADTTPDAMDTGLEEDILKTIPSDIPEMYVEAMVLRKLPQVIH